MRWKQPESDIHENTYCHSHAAESEDLMPLLYTARQFQLEFAAHAEVWDLACDEHAEYDGTTFCWAELRGCC